MVETVKLPLSQTILKTAVPLFLALVTATTLTACQPEPTSIDSLKDGGNVSEQVEGETTWGGGEGPEYTPNTVFPESFPRESIPLADGNVIDVGERSPGVWYVNIDVSEVAAFDVAMSKLEAAGFSILSDQAAGSDRAATLENERFDINLLSVSGDGTVTLSYDISTRN